MKGLISIGTLVLFHPLWPTVLSHRVEAGTIWKCSWRIQQALTIRFVCIFAHCLQSSHVKRTPQDSINEFIIRKLNPSVVVDLKIHLCIPACVMSSEFTREVVMKFLPAQFSAWIWCKCLQGTFTHSKIFLSDRIKRSYRKNVIACYACRNADLNLKMVAATTNGFIFK